MTSSTAVVVGAGTMGRGIAQVLVESGWRVHMVDPMGDAAAQGQEAVQAAWARAVARGRLDAAHAAALEASLDAAPDYERVEGPPAWVIEAASEDLELKRRLLAELESRWPAGTRLASNTSSLTIASLQGGLRHPERLGGLHFFNPVPRMALVEVIASPATGAAWTAAAFDLARGLGKTPVPAPDRPGFLVNRVMRPFYAEALRLVEEEVAPPEVVDAVMEGAGFPMGPFRLMDLVGIDVNLAVTAAVYAQTFGEDRYRPHPRQQMMRDLGWLGRKRGRGFYDYRPSTDLPTEAPPAPPPEAPRSGGLVAGSPAFQQAWRRLSLPGRLSDEPPEPGLLRFWVDPDPGAEPPRPAGPATLLVVDGTRQHVEPLAARWGRPVVGFDPALVLAGAKVMTVSGYQGPEVAQIFAPLRVVPVEDAIGHVFSRIVCSLVDEALRFRPRIDPAVVDRAVELGVNHPRGPHAWLGRLGAERVAAVLAALRLVGGERYRPSEDLLRAAEREPHASLAERGGI